MEAQTPSHYSAIGFRVSSQEDFTKVLDQALESGETLASPRGQYVRWAPGAGVQLWVGIDKRKRIVCCEPHFAGSSRVRVSVTDAFRPHKEYWEGSIDGWADPETDDPESGAYPFRVDVPDFDLIRDRLPCPLTVTMQIAAFAHELQCFADDAEFDASQEEEFKFAAESFIPSGLFAEAGEDGQPSGGGPCAEAMFAGHVQEAELRTNPTTELQFHYLSVRTWGGVYDVVADPTVPEGGPVVGGIVQGTSWLSGRIVSELPPPRRGLLPRLFGRS